MTHEHKRNRHTRKAYRLGEIAGEASAPHAEDIAEYTATWIETAEDVAYAHAENSRDAGSARGLNRLNHIEAIATDGVTLSRFCTNGDSCMMAVHGGASSGVVDEHIHLMDETLDAYDKGFVTAFLENADRLNTDT